MNTITIELPIYWQQSGKKTVLVSMNAYRNWHYAVSAKFKREFTELVLAQITAGIKVPSPYRVEMLIYYKNSQCDASNIVALIEKVTLDALVSAGVAEDDTVKHHLGTEWRVGGQDKTNPRCLFLIKPSENIDD